MPKSIPPEIIHAIMSWNHPWNLPALSLVCRLWQALAFPTLYHTVFLDRYRHTIVLVDRINSETDHTPLRMAHCARNLLVSFDLPYDYDSASMGFLRGDFSRLKEAISKLHKLERLAWDTGELVLHFGSLVPTQIWAKLQSINLKIDLNELSPSQIQSVFCFENLLHASITLFRSYRDDAFDVSTILAAMLRASPALESLSIHFPNESSLLSPHWDPPGLISMLADDYFPHLRVLRILSAWLSPICPPVRLFLHKHPDIHTLCFGTVHMHVPRATSANDLAVVAPSVRHFEGPVFLVKALFGSRISSQLETLTIVQGVKWESFTDTAVLQLFHAVPKELPHLRVLRIKFETGVDNAACLTGVAPMLEELELIGHLGMYSGSYYSEKCLQMLSLTPRLRVLTLQQRRGHDGENSQLTTSSVKIFLQRAALMCPQLDSIHHMNGSARSGSWSIKHLGQNNVETVYISTHRSNPFSSLGVACISRPNQFDPWVAIGLWF